MKSRSRVYRLTDTLRWMGQSIGRRCHRSVALQSRALKDRKIRSTILHEVAKDIRKETVQCVPSQRDIFTDVWAKCVTGLFVGLFGVSSEGDCTKLACHSRWRVGDSWTPLSKKGKEDQSADQQTCNHWSLCSYYLPALEPPDESCAAFSSHSSVQRRCQ